MPGGAAGRRGILKKHRDQPDTEHDFDNQEEDFFQTPIDNIEEWSNYLSEELAETYHVLVDHCSSIGADFFASNQGFFPDFVEWAFQTSSRLPIK